MSEQSSSSARSDESSEELSHRGTVVFLVVALFVFLRGTIAAVRSVFFDELFTRWIVSFSPAGIMQRLRFDSGPPLYYLIAWLLPDDSTVPVLRLLSLCLSLCGLGVVLLLVRDARVRVAAALVLATWPVHVVMSGDARAYALLATLTGLVVVASWRWVEEGRARWLVLAALALAGAVWTHWYGILFVPQLAVAALFSRARWRRAMVQAAAATAGVAILASPALLLLREQPDEAAAWMSAGAAAHVFRTLAAMSQALSPIPALPGAIAPGVVPGGGVLATAVVVAGLILLGHARGRNVAFAGSMVLVPVAGVLALVGAGVPAYFPGRFESSLAVAFALALACAWAQFDVKVRRIAAIVWLALGLVTWMSWMIAFPKQQEDPWRLTASYAREAVGSNETIIATGPLYLELLSQIDDEWSPAIIAFPSEQAEHPGWRAAVPPVTLQSEVMKLPAEGWWAGEAGTGEMRALARRYGIRPEFTAGPVGLARLSARAE